jgi:hypothetical protein
MVNSNTSSKLNEWIVNGSVGISSKTIWGVLQGIKVGRDNKPYDPDDFSRCYTLVKQCNLQQEDLEKVSIALPYWKPYIDNWGKLTEMYELNVKENWVNSKEIGMYEFMKVLCEESNLICLKY